jgi:hypothetical protein
MKNTQGDTCPGDLCWLVAGVQPFGPQYIHSVREGMVEALDMVKIQDIPGYHQSQQARAMMRLHAR